MDSIVDLFDYIDRNSFLRYFIFIITWYSWFKFKTTRLYSIIIIFLNKEKLLKHRIFFELENIQHVEIQIEKLGRKEVFGDLLFYETCLFADFTRKIILDITKQEEYPHIKNILLRKILQTIKFYRNFHFTNKTLSVYILDEYDKLLISIRNILLYASYDNIDIRHVDKIKYARQNSIPDRVDERFIINEIKKEKMKLVLFKYESIMSNYRNQIKKNVQVYFSSKMPIDQLLEGILSYCFLSVYKNILDTIHRDINKINGEFKGIIYEGYEL